MGMVIDERILEYVVGSCSRDQVRWKMRAVDLIVTTLTVAFGRETTEAWLFGMNSHLDDRAPAMVLRYVASSEAAQEVVDAARSFVSGA